MPLDIYSAQSIIESLGTHSSTKAPMLKAFARRMELYGENICFFNEPFTPVSLTGTRCALECRHCNSHYLNHMLDGSPGKLYTQAANLSNKGAKGILLSGGSMPDGSVPTYEQADIIL